MIRIFFLLGFLIFGLNRSAFSQISAIEIIKPLSSLALCDSSIVAEAYAKGIKENIQQASYWASLSISAARCGFTIYECKGLEMLGDVYYRHNNNLPKATACLEKALAIAEANGYSAEMIPMIRQLQRLYALQLHRKRAIYFIYKGLKISGELRDKKSFVDFYSFLGNYYFSSGEIPKAMEIHFQCLRACRMTGDDFGISSALVDIGSDYIALHKPEIAASYYLASKKYLGALSETIYGVQICNSLSTAYMILEQRDSAYLYGEKALAIAQKLNNNVAMASALQNIAGMHYTLGDYSAAGVYALKAYEYTRSVNFMAQMPLLLDLMKMIHIKNGNYKDALAVYEHYVVVNDSFSSEKIRKQTLEAVYSYQLQKKQHEYMLLSQANEIQTLRLIEHRYLIGFLGLLLVSIVVMGWLFLKHSQIRADHTKIQMEQKLLRSQMDPHFIFNSLNSIQQLIMTGNNESAELYLSKFSKLMRKLLETNIKTTITVKEELEMLHAYLEMESLRASNNFLYTIDVEAGLDTAHINIPHLMIQPFVENAVWHGLQAKEDNRVLIITLSRNTEDTLRCVVDDNGIGREASKEKQKLIQKKSIAIDLAQQRIELIRKTFKINGSIDLFDKKNAENKSLGTTVTLILPILKS